MENKEIKIEDHLGLVHFVCKKYSNAMEKHCVEYDDLFQIGCMGLMRAVEMFDKNKGCTFSTYAISNIRSYIHRFLRDDKYMVAKNRDLRLKGEFYYPGSLSKIIFGEGNTTITIMDTIKCDKDNYFDTEMICCVKALGEEFLKIYRLRYEFAYTQAEIGKMLGVSQVYIGRKLKILHNKLKQLITI